MTSSPGHPSGAGAPNTAPQDEATMRCPASTSVTSQPIAVAAGLGRRGRNLVDVLTPVELDDQRAHGLALKGECRGECRRHT